VSHRTFLQREADKIDCQLFRLISQVETLATREPEHSDELRTVSRALRLNRTGIRMLMHIDDRKLTE
jgi:hypothetical protein